MIELSDIDRLLGATEDVDESTTTQQIRDWRDDLVKAAVFLSYARHVLSVDVGVLKKAAKDPQGLDALVDDLPAVLARASVGGGWSLSSDAPARMIAADQAILGAADGLMSAHMEMAFLDFTSRDSLEGAISRIGTQLDDVTDRWQITEMRVRLMQAVIVERYSIGAAQVDDWLR